MKLVKFIPALAATMVLAACSTASDAVSSVGSAVSNTVDATTTAVKDGATAVKDGVESAKNAVMGKSTKAVAYTCQNNTVVVANYSFDGEKATGVSLIVNKKAVKGLARDDKNTDFTSFASASHVWNVDAGLTAATFDKSTDGMLFKKGKDSDQILAKSCQVNVEATKKLAM